MKNEFFKNFQFGQKITSTALTTLYEKFVDTDVLYIEEFGNNKVVGGYFVTIDSRDGTIVKRASFVLAETIGGIDIMECIYINN